MSQPSIDGMPIANSDFSLPTEWGEQVDLQVADFNVTDSAFNKNWGTQWKALEAVLKGMPLHLKASDQEGIQGNAIFDPVGTNAYICDAMERAGWHPNVQIPAEFSFLGKGVDFISDGVLTEVQFSNYPFLLNNLLRAELLVNSKTKMRGAPVEAVIIIAKAKLFPSSNSTLYYEQGYKQIKALSDNRVFAMPMRLVGLFSPVGTAFDAVWTEYHAARYSRTVVTTKTQRVRIDRRTGPNGRCDIVRV